jgi:zinc protease
VLTVKHTDFSKDSISIVALTGNGEQSFSPDRIDPHLGVLEGTPLGGLGKLNRDEISRSLNGHLYGAGLQVVGNKVRLSGGTRRADLQLEMQVLAAYLIDPAFRSAPFEKFKASYPAQLEMTYAIPSAAFGLASREILAGGDKRKAVPTTDEVASWSIDDLRPGAKALLAKGAIHITMVGDLSVDEAIAAVASTFGALPPRPPLDPPAAGAERRHFPGPTAEPLHFTHTGIGEQGLGFVAWPTTDEVDSLAESRRLRLMTAIVRLRALDEIREHLALAYSPNVGADFSDVYRGYGFIDVQAQTAPGQLPNFFKAVDGIAQSLRDKPISDDELKRARAPMIESLRHEMNTNLWWVTNLTNVVDRPRIADEMLTGISVLEKVTPADVQAMARKYLRPDTAWRAEVTPSAGATASDGWRPESGDSSVPAADPIKSEIRH